MTFAFPTQLTQALVDAVPALDGDTDRLVFVVVADRPDPGTVPNEAPVGDLFGPAGIIGENGAAIVQGVVGELNDLGFDSDRIYIAAGGVDAETTGVVVAAELELEDDGAGQGEPVDPQPTDEPELGTVPGDVVEPEPEDGAVIPPADEDPLATSPGDQTPATDEPAEGVSGGDAGLDG